MNEHTPKRLSGSLIQRAIAMMPGLPVEEAPARPQPASPAQDRPMVPIDRNRLAAAGMLVPGGPITPLAEEFRMVKRQLLLTARGVAGVDADRARMILVCSAQPDEGKTFCAINLALSMAAEKDVEILLVDADFAKPDVSKRLGMGEGPGLLDALDGQIDVEACIVDTDVPQLAILPAGTRSVSDTELLASDGARAMLDRLAAANPRRIVIFDSPPALAASPASVLALHVGQTMMVVRADRTSEEDLRAAVAALDGCEHIQLVLNAVSFQPSGRRFGSYYAQADR
jgi:exopolysaccharide/PEP-CTERM locus tyrosine autokinase